MNAQVKNGHGDVQSLKFSGRSITLTEQGIEWEGDKTNVLVFLEKLET